MGTQMTQCNPESPQKPNLLIYAHYYYPDVASTGQILQELAEGMLSWFHITIICTVPSYGGTISGSYTYKKYYSERVNGVNLIRVRVPNFDKARKISRVKNIMAYFFRAMWATWKTGDVDCVYAISQPPILGGLLGVWGKWAKHAKFIYNIQDFNPEQTIATGYSKNGMILKAMMALDKYSCKQADKVIVVGRDMVDTLRKRFKEARTPSYAFINNWIDEKKIYPLSHTEPHVAGFREKYGLADKFVIMYSGNLGLYYDLENLLKVIQKFPVSVQTADGRKVVFAFVGAGSIQGKLVSYKTQNQLDNVVFIPYQDKENLNYSLNAADMHWCISAEGIKGVSVPSKLYGIMATGKPVLGVLENGSEARLIMEESQCGVLCRPGNYGEIEAQIRWVLEHAADGHLKEMGDSGRAYLVRNLTKEVSVAKYVEEIMKCGITPKAANCL